MGLPGQIDEDLRRGRRVPGAVQNAGDLRHRAEKREVDGATCRGEPEARRASWGRSRLAGDRRRFP